MTLHLGPGLELPDEAATETFAMLGQRGSGKSTVAVVMAEQMWAAGIPWVAIDPKGDWWGIRSGPDGTSPGLPLPIFGGLHGDLPLEAGAGAFLADLFVDQNLTAVLDVSDLSKADRARLLVTFFDRLYRRHQAAPSWRHLFLEEAHEYIPQLVGREEGRLKEAASRIVLMGRTFGLGASLLSQRSARLHKDVLTQVATLIAKRVQHRLDREAIEAWTTEHAVGREIVGTLPGLQAAEGWLLSPSFLGRTERVTFDRRSTFDSGATPVRGGAVRPPATLADVDLAAVKTAMAETIARAEADDPKALRRRITALETELAAARRAQPVGLDSAAVSHLQAHADGVELAAESVGEGLATLQGALDMLRAAVRTVSRPEPVSAVAPAVSTATVQAVGRIPPPAPPPTVELKQAAAAALDGGVWADLGRAEQTFITVLARHRDGLTRIQLALLSGYTIKSSTIKNALGRLRAAGWVTPAGVEPIALTAWGHILATGLSLDALPTGQALYDYWASRLNRAENTVLQVMVAAWPDELTRSHLADATGYSATSSTLKNTLGRLRSLGLVDGWQAADAFVEAVRS